MYQKIFFQVLFFKQNFFLMMQCFSIIIVAIKVKKYDNLLS